jgi:hypothetical protein
MPRIVVVADARDRAVMFTERVNVSDFESRHFQVQLVERLGWAVEDAQAVEQDPASVAEVTDTPQHPAGDELRPIARRSVSVSGAQPVS